MVQNANQNVVNAVNTITTQPNYLSNQVMQMNLQQLQAFSDQIDTYKRNDQLIAALPQALIPEVAHLHAERERIDNALAAIDSAVELAFAEAYYTDNKGYNSDGFYDLVQTQLQNLKDQQTNNEMRAEIQRQAQLMAQQQVAAQQAASSSGAPMQEG